MRNVLVGLAALAAVGIAMPVAAPANAETVKKVIIKKKGDAGVRKKVVIKHGDRDRRRVVIKRKVSGDNIGYHRGSRTVVKKKVIRD